MRVDWDSYIGTKYKTPVGGVLTVTQIFKNDKGKVQCVCHCSICSMDSELWGDVKIVSSKDKLDSGTTPCGCAINHIYTPQQNLIRVSRECLVRGYTFFGWKGNNYVGNKTYLLLGNPKTGNYWDTCTMGNFFRGKGDPEEKRLNISKRRKPAEYYTKQLEASGLFLEGTKFYQYEDLYKSDYFKYWCPVCSVDEYSQNGLCTGIFSGRFSNLMKGIKGCRCAVSPRLTDEQKSFKLNKILQSEGCKFIKFKGKRVEWFCGKNHLNSTGYQDFLSGIRCDKCSLLRQDWGLYKERLNDIDTLYLLEFRDVTNTEVFIKIGRTFNFKSRLRYFRRFYEVRLINKLEGLHINVFTKEKELHRLVTKHSYFPNKPFKGCWYECFTPEILNHPEVISTFNLKEQPNDQHP